MKTQTTTVVVAAAKLAAVADTAAPPQNSFRLHLRNVTRSRAKSKGTKEPHYAAATTTTEMGNNAINSPKKNRTIINYRHKRRRKFQMALLLLLYLCHHLSIAECLSGGGFDASGSEVTSGIELLMADSASGGDGGEEASTSFDLTTAQIREPKDVGPPARLSDLSSMHGSNSNSGGDSDDEDEDEDDFGEHDYLDVKSSRK